MAKDTKPNLESGEADPALRLDDSRPVVSREQLVVGFGVPHLEKLRARGAVDLRGDSRLESAGAGYLRVTPLDLSRRHG
jgi:hypothetical protein